MSFSVTDAAVQEFVDRLSRGESTSDVFAARISECTFTPEQRDRIKTARRERKALVKDLKKAAQALPENAPASKPAHPEPPKSAAAIPPQPPAPPKNIPAKHPQPPSPANKAPAKQPPQPNPPKKPKAPQKPPPPKAPALNKLEKMLYLQQGKCFFCGEPLAAAEATIEHLHPISQGGQRVESNEVVCHRSVNEAFGAMDLKRKIKFILDASGKFRCP
jgi:5-methylcytosine-specific restriction endonuclease McrA